ncbi:MAG: response regulator [Oligoflexia bacterium]|nr:response regulator [Oligoflexia bacterium]MBF0364774.1 response regulator [Oligoflexia bacterium]
MLSKTPSPNFGLYAQSASSRTPSNSLTKPTKTSAPKKNKEDQMIASLIEQEEELRVIIFDDSDYTRKKIIDILEQAKYQVVGDASTPTEAMMLLQTSKANLIIIDVVMPEIGGLEFAKFVHDKFPLVMMVMLTSITYESLILECIATGVLDFIYRPFTSQQVIDAVSKIDLLLKKK